MNLARTFASRAVCLLALWLVSGPCVAVVPDSWKDTLYSYRAGSASLSSVLGTFAKTLGVDLKLTESTLARQVASPEASAQNPGAFLDKLGQAHGFQWFLYNGTLHVSSLRSSVTERLRLGGLTGPAARQALTGLGLFDPRFGWGDLDEDTAMALVSGPPAYVELVKGIVGKVVTDTTAETPEVMVFRLRYASADDREASVRDKSVMHAGVASSLRNILGSANGRSPLGTRGDDFKGLGPVALSKANAFDRPASGAATGSSGAKRANFVPTIEAYPPLNAVLVRDFPDKRKFYEQLITSLDVAVEQVEILVTIVDADSNALREWSPNFSLGGVNGASVDPGLASAANPLAGGSGAKDPTVVLWAQGKLSVRLRALESEGTAQVISRPSVLTLDNVGAVLDMSQSAFFRLVGERTADLKSVTAGTLLKVTPRIRTSGTDTAIQVDLEIEDGSIQNAGNATDTPLSSRNAVSTQAILRPDEALVVGGYRQRQNSAVNGRIPVLGSIPFIGALFRSESSNSSNKERLFIVTARVVGRG